MRGPAQRKPTVPEVLPRIRDYYAKHPTGGSLHVVLDDGNVSDTHVAFCIREARERQDTAGVELGEQLLRMSRTQRVKLASGCRSGDAAEAR